MQDILNLFKGLLLLFLHDKHSKHSLSHTFCGRDIDLSCAIGSWDIKGKNDEKIIGIELSRLRWMFSHNQIRDEVIIL